MDYPRALTIMISPTWSCRPCIGGLLAVFLLLAITGSSRALGQNQPEPPSPPPGPPPVESRLERMMEEMAEKLKLSEEQTSAVRTILADRMTKQRELFEESRERDRNAREEMREEMMKIRDEGDAKIKELLSEEQAKAYDQFMKEHRPRRGGRGRRGPRSRS